jgi:hypothetical protein
MVNETVGFVLGNVMIVDDDEAEMVPLDEDDAGLGSDTTVGSVGAAELLALRLDNEDTDTDEDAEGEFVNVIAVLIVEGVVAIELLAVGLLGIGLVGAHGHDIVTVVTNPEIVLSTVVVCPVDD